jgi:hypothetical protein
VISNPKSEIRKLTADLATAMRAKAGLKPPHSKRYRDDWTHSYFLRPMVRGAFTAAFHTQTNI